MKKISWLLCLVLVLPFLVVGCEKNQTQLNFYHIEAQYNEDENTLACSQIVKYFNNFDNALSEVCFSLYANSFEEGQNTVSTAYQNRAYPNGESFGKIEFEQILVGGQETFWSIDEKNHNILTVELPSQLFPSEMVEISMQYVVQLANINHRLGYGENCINFGNFFPIACVYEGVDGFVKNEFVANGDPFYSDVSNFEVEITCPKNFVVASSGVQQKTEEKSNLKTISCKAEKVRDFCFVLSSKFEMMSDTYGGVTINYFYFDDENAQKHLETATKSLATFEELFGKYPYETLSVVKTDFCFGGMEYPNLVMISSAVEDDETYDYVIVHEIAHQWWYGVVGNNEYQDAWIDEGLTEYSTALFFEQNAEYGFDYNTIMDNACDTYKNFVKIYKKINGSCDESMNRNLSQFATEPEYVNCTYTKGMLLFDSLRQMLGKNKFMRCLKNYYEEYAFENSSAEKLIESFSKSAKINLSSYIKSWTDGTAVIN